MRRFDALVIGGGPAGSASALLLARSGWSVVLLERRRFPRRKVCGEYLSPTSWPILEAAGLSTLREEGGPEVRRVGLIHGSHCLSADLPRPKGEGPPWGRAIRRERLDSLLLERAIEEGVEVRQPFTARALRGEEGSFTCEAESEETGERIPIPARVVIAAHGSWEPGGLPTHPPRLPPRASDLLAFKAHFLGAELETALMPLLSFPGGYGGLVHCDGGRVTLSLCIRRDRLARLPLRPGGGAGERALEFLIERCPALGPILSAAVRDGPWLSAGPIRPGRRTPYAEGIFRVGNAAGEAHPVVAEGISMALQGAWLLAEEARRIDSPLALPEAGRRYAAAWRRSFAPRIRAARLVAHWAMRPGPVEAALPLIRRFPSLLTLGARLSGKARRVAPWKAMVTAAGGP